MHNTMDVLSIWEIAHRWFGYDPNLTNQAALPLEVQDLIRLITKKMYRHEMSTFSECGVEYKNLSGLPAYEDFVPSYSDEQENLSEYDKDDIKYQQYLDMKRIYSEQHDKVVKNFERCFSDRVFDKDELDHSYLGQWAIQDFCIEMEIPPPEFWFSKNEIETICSSFRKSHTFDDKWLRNRINEIKGMPATDKVQKQNKSSDEDGYFKGRHANSRLDRELCRAVAGTLWDLHSDLNIQQVIEHSSLQKRANGAQYKGKETIRNWIKDLDPRPAGKRRGRPKKSK